MSVSPLIIKLALAYHTTAAPDQFFPTKTWESEAVDGAHEWLTKQGLLSRTDGGAYAPTKKLEAWVSFICATPLPVQRWILPKREGDV